MNNVIDSIQVSGITYQIQGSGGGGVPESTFTAYTATTDERISQDEEVTAAGLNALNNKITPTVELTQAQYDALATKDPNTYYIITDAQAVDLTNYYTKSETNTLLGGKADTATTYTKTEVDTALGGKQATLVSGTNIKTINNESLLGSGNLDIQGGSTYSAGRGISIANDTISFNLPISAGTNDNLIIGDTSNKVNDPYNSGKSIVFGRYSTVKSYDSLVGGYYCSNEKGQSQVFGNRSKTKNQYEFGCGRYNNSVSGSSTFGDSGNTLFSVGNGTADNARHNAFEIRQNGDIYLTLDGQDVKLQDQLGGGGTVDQTIISGSTNAVAGGAVYNKIDEVEQVTAAGLNALNDNFGGLKLVKLTQTEYNALATKDSSTLYIIVN